uniref:HGWP repeat containing protein-like n=1 Tax=Oryza rufipogon TaxID=4529 RepID=A0A679BD23_ORYRU|nr:HGWP repeat containing protein-like [Oryza rufipogon]
MARKKRLNIVHSSCHHGNGEGSSSGQSLPQVEPPLPYEDEVIHVEQQDDEPLNMPVQDEEVKKRKGTTLRYVWDLPPGKRIVTKFLYPPSCVQWILKSIGRDWRRYKAALKDKYFNPKKKRSALYKLCPDDVEKDQWIPLIKYWKSKKGKALSAKNKRSRSMLQNPHSAGTKSYARWSEDLRQDDPNKKQPHRAMVYLATHKKKDKDKNQHVVTLENLIDEQPELAQNDQGRVAWEGDALNKVLGKEKPGQVHGMGLLPVPKQVYVRTSHHLKNINITTVNDSSSDEETHVRGEVGELKKLVKTLGQRIEELENKGTSNGNSEPTMNKRRCEEQQNMHHDNILDLCGKKHQEADNNIGSPCQDDSSSQPHLAHHLRREMNKKKHRNLEKFAKTTEKQDTQKKTAHHMAQNRVHSSSMKVGTTIILVTAKYPNKETVAYATYLSSNPRDKVDGVEIGNEFTKVVVNHPLKEDEELVQKING